jgi:hypothetical protein
MIFEVRLTYKDMQIINRGKEDEKETPVFINVHISDENLHAFMKSLEDKKTYWLDDNKGGFWTNPDMLRFVQAFPIEESKNESDNKKISE